MERLYRNLQNSQQTNHLRRQLASSSLPGHLQLQANRSLPNPSAAFDAWSRIAFLNSNPMAKPQANPLRGLLSVKPNQALGLNRNININIAQNIHVNPSPPVGRDLIAEKNTRIRNEINRMIFTSSVNSSATGIERYACNKCNRSYRNKNHLYRHVRYECDRKKRYQCGICMKDFYRKDNLKTHIGYKHSEYKTSNFVLINKEEEDDEMQLDAHNNNNLVISKNELNEMLNKTDNTQQVLSILNNSESSRAASIASDQKFLHLKLQQEQNKLQRSLLLRIQTENNKITPSQSEVLSKLLSANTTPVQLKLPAKQLEIFAQPSSKFKAPPVIKPDPDLLRKDNEFIDMEDGFNDDVGSTMSNEEEEDDEFVPIEPFVHIDMDCYQDTDNTSRSEGNKEIKAILRSSNDAKDDMMKPEKEKKTDKTISTLTMEDCKPNTLVKTEPDNTSKQKLPRHSEESNNPS